eukprot:comp17840_c0_seq1/m.17999 comp17840_c0_seq1/g.17999  ORF comp17840_c0_seq1/g.17999 comp17840_c0_seq1/m.17999 type:complete len:179 (-) comp17840_c0_seq1:420-956(-)
MKKLLLVAAAAAVLENAAGRSAFHHESEHHVTGAYVPLAVAEGPPLARVAPQGYRRTARSLADPVQQYQNQAPHVPYRVIADTDPKLHLQTGVNQYPGDAERQAFLEWYAQQQAQQEQALLDARAKSNSPEVQEQNDQIVAMALGITFGFVAAVAIVVGTVYAHKKGWLDRGGKKSSA